MGKTSIQLRRGATQWAPLQRAQWSLWIHRETCRMNRVLSKFNKTRETYESHCLPITQTRTLKCYTSVYNCWKSCRCKYRKTCRTQMSKTTTCWWNQAKKWGDTVLRTWKTQHTKDIHSPKWTSKFSTVPIKTLARIFVRYICSKTC